MRPFFNQGQLEVADYAIGDIQGCYDSLLSLLDKIHYNDRTDKLWFVGDLVNRGPKSLEVLRFIQQLSIKPNITLGNHDLHLIYNLLCPVPRKNADDTLDPILNAPESDEIGHWLRRQSILIHDESLGVVLCHAGIPPCFTLEEAKTHAKELETVLQGNLYLDFLQHMYGAEPSLWSNALKGNERLRFLCNAFTRMRYCDQEGRLLLQYKGSHNEHAMTNCYPWFATPNRKPIENVDIVFGHWAALEGKCSIPRMHAIDTGCLWGGSLTALRLQDMQRFAVQGSVLDKKPRDY